MTNTFGTKTTRLISIKTQSCYVIFMIFFVAQFQELLNINYNKFQVNHEKWTTTPYACTWNHYYERLNASLLGLNVTILTLYIVVRFDIRYVLSLCVGDLIYI